MKTKGALKVFDALSHRTRLKVFRVLLEHGNQGLAAGVLSEKLGVPDSTLSFHLLHLKHAKLVHARKEKLSIIYSASLERLQELLEYLLSSCEIESSFRADLQSLFDKKIADMKTPPQTH